MQVFVCFMNGMIVATNVIASASPPNQELANEDVMIVFVDVDVFSGCSQAFYGVVVKDGNGNFACAKNGQVRCLDDPHHAEALAVKEALS